MDSGAKKISFGFSKLQKQSVVTKNKFKPPDEKVEYIDCLESHKIKIRSTGPECASEDQFKENGEVDIKPIPMRKNTLRTAHEKTQKEDIPQDNSLDSLAAREILEDSKEQKEIVAAPLTIEQREKEAAELQRESTLDDYEAVPISSFGMAMLRGMGWDPNKGVGKNEKKVKLQEVTLRPKGLGLGAGKQGDNNLVRSNAEETKIEMGSQVQILGKSTSEVGEVVSFNEDSGRLVIKKLDGSFTSVHEMMVKVLKKDESKSGSNKRSSSDTYGLEKKHKSR